MAMPKNSPVSNLVLLPGLMAVLFVSSCNKQVEQKAVELPTATKDGTPVVAMVGSEPITYGSLQVIAAQNGYDLRDPKQVELALRDATNNEILAAEAKRLGYEDDPEIRRYVKSQAVQKLLLASVDSTQQAPQPPTEAELKAYYDANLAEFTPPTLARAQVLALLKRKDQESSFTQKLDAVKKAIESKEVPFTQLVEQFSDDPAAKGYGGTTNWLVKGEENKRYPQELVNQVFAAADDKTISGPIVHGEWTYFVKLQERRGGEATPFAQAKSGIERNLMRRKRLDAYNALVSSLQSKTKVQTFPDKVAAQIPKATEDSGPPAGPAGPVTKQK